LKSRKFSPEIKICVLELVAEIFEKDIELLDLSIQSYSFQDPKQFFENLPSPKKEEMVLPFDF
jgi:hypothetical protein